MTDMRSEVAVTYRIKSGHVYDGWRVGGFAVARAVVDAVDGRTGKRFPVEEYPFRVDSLAGDHEGIVAETESLAWLFADEMAIHLDGLSGDALLAGTDRMRPWRDHCRQHGPIRYRHWLHASHPA